jgi:hypothetical protein
MQEASLGARSYSSAAGSTARDRIGDVAVVELRPAMRRSVYFTGSSTNTGIWRSVLVW